MYPPLSLANLHYFFMILLAQASSGDRLIYNTIEICIILGMRITSSRLDRQQQVQVVIRLKPFEPQPLNHKCVYLSEQENQLVVEAGSKKEIFVFDHVAPESASQLDIYRMMGQEAVERSLEGYNCCIFAYGQTGAGKTYSVSGDLSQLQSNPYCQSRGIIPRLLEDLFQRLSSNPEQRHSVNCSFMQIYNQQIFDLLSHDKRIHQLREDFKRGVFVEGLSQPKITSYKEAIELIMEGEKNKKIAATIMNAESSRSHVIFTVNIESEIIEEDMVKVRKSKLHVVDLAGSERVKHTLVEGDRLKEGCNINKSLHVLGNVINSLVESAKKKKHIPFRDSKLTYYLKDSLGGNSITKLLANIHCGKLYYGDTLSTLMFAKRAKILKMKVQINENLTQNFDHLRKQVKKLRQQLAQARYFKGDKQKSQGSSFQQDLQLGFQRITDNTQYEFTPKNEIIHSLQENQLHYKALIDIYEEHMNSCQNQKKKQNLNMVSQWKNLEKRNKALTGIIRKTPAFSRIYKENLLLRQEKNKLFEPISTISNQQQTSRTLCKSPSVSHHQQTVQTIDPEQIINMYEQIIQEMKQKFQSAIEILQKNYSELEQECKSKDKKIKELFKREIEGHNPDIEQLKNENEYLHLNILNLEDEIAKLVSDEHKVKLERRQERKTHKRNSLQQRSSLSLQSQENQQDYAFIVEKLIEIKAEALREADAAEHDRQQLENIIDQLRLQMRQMQQQNNKLRISHNRSRSHRKSRQKHSSIQPHFTNAKKSCIDLVIPRQQHFHAHKSNLYLSDYKPDLQHKKQIITMKMQIKTKQKQVLDLQHQVDCFMASDKKIEDEFGKDIEQIIRDYREMMNKKLINSNKSIRSINKWKEQEPSVIRAFKVDHMLEEKIEKKIHQGESKGHKFKEINRATKKEDGSKVKKKIPV